MIDYIRATYEENEIEPSLPNEQCANCDEN